MARTGRTPRALGLLALPLGGGLEPHHEGAAVELAEDVVADPGHGAGLHHSPGPLARRRRRVRVRV